VLVVEVHASEIVRQPSESARQIDLAAGLLSDAAPAMPATPEKWPGE
jgi:hypothetical protein